MAEAKELTNVDVVVYALAVLGGSDHTIYSEDVAARCYDLAPSRFSWRLLKYRKKGWPDKYIVKTALEDAKKDEYGALVEGSYALDSTKDGWRLTPKGATWFKANAIRIEQELNSKPQETSVAALDKKRFLRTLQSQQLYKNFVMTGNLNSTSRYEFTDMLNCSPDASQDMIISKYNRVRATAELIGNEDVIRFLDACKAAYLVSTVA
jgi:hypothetical protein